MALASLPRRLTASAALAIALALVGCGGGGGGGGKGERPGSYAVLGGSLRVAATVDAAGRVTFFVRGADGQPQGGGQGTLGTTGQFVAQSTDGVFLVSGTVAADGSALSGTVTRGGQSLGAFTAPRVAPGAASPGTIIGTFAGTSGANRAYVTVDATGHATMWAVAGSETGGGLMGVAADGSMVSSDGSAAARLTLNGTTRTLHITRLDGATVDVTLDVSTVARARWTFMVFLNAANDLQEYGPLNVNQMEKVGSTTDVNIVVQWKQANCFGCGNPDWTGTRRYYVARDDNTQVVTSPMVEDMGAAVDMGDYNTLRSFILWAQQNYPAERYALVIWNHGAGWRSTRGDRLPPPFLRSVSIDDHSGNEIDTWQLPQALNVTPQLDMVIFDASLMQMLEVAYEIRNSSPIMVGSEESPPGEGYVYDGFMADLVANPGMSAAQFGAQIVTRTYESYGASSNITQSVIDLTQMGTLATRVDSLADQLNANLAADATAITNARRNAQSYSYAENKDLWHYAELLRTQATSPGIQTAASNVQAALAGAVLSERHGSFNPNSHGLAIYVPSSTGYLTSYSNLSFARSTDWDTFLANQP